MRNRATIDPPSRQARTVLATVKAASRCRARRRRHSMACSDTTRRPWPSLARRAALSSHGRDERTVSGRTKERAAQRWTRRVRDTCCGVRAPISTDVLTRYDDRLRRLWAGGAAAGPRPPRDRIPAHRSPRRTSL